MLRQAAVIAGTLTDKHRFLLKVSPTAALLQVDRGKIEQVLENILSNAVKYSPKGGEIRLAGVLSAEDYEICVEDEGIGMTAEQVEKVFEKFYRVDSSNTAVEGTGLGMSIVRHIVDAHGGRVWVESEPDRGTRVFVSLPLVVNEKKG
jgi:signal transduction histidine kinase